MKRHLTAGQGAREPAEPSGTCWAGRANRRRAAAHGRGGGGGAGGRGPGRSEVIARGAPSVRAARAAAAMNSAEQTVTWLITLGVLESPKKTISDPEVFLQASLKDGVVLCRLLERLLPGTIEKVSGPGAVSGWVPGRGGRRAAGRAGAPGARRLRARAPSSFVHGHGGAPGAGTGGGSSGRHCVRGVGKGTRPEGRGRGGGRFDARGGVGVTGRRVDCAGACGVLLHPDVKLGGRLRRPSQRPIRKPSLSAA